MHNLQDGVRIPSEPLFKQYNVFPRFYESIDWADDNLGQLAELGSETVNAHNIDNKLWMRATALGAALWSKESYANHERFGLLTRLQQQFYRRGLNASAVTSQQCERYVHYCAN
jgi:hypothetical protein